MMLLFGHPRVIVCLLLWPQFRLLFDDLAAHNFELDTDDFDCLFTKVGQVVTRNARSGYTMRAGHVHVEWGSARRALA